jgi:hypothetical protein
MAGVRAAIEEQIHGGVVGGMPRTEQRRLGRDFSGVFTEDVLAGIAFCGVY